MIDNIGVSKIEIGCPKDTQTPLWLILWPGVLGMQMRLHICFVIWLTKCCFWLDDTIKAKQKIGAVTRFF